MALLDGQEESTGIFDCLLDFAQESHRFPSVDKPVIVRQGNKHHGTNNHLEAHHENYSKSRLLHTTIDALNGYSSRT